MFTCSPHHLYAMKVDRITTKTVYTRKKTKAASVFTFLLPRNSDHACDDSLGMLQLLCLCIPSCTQLRVSNCTFVTSQLNYHLLQRCKHVNRIPLFIRPNGQHGSKGPFLALFSSRNAPGSLVCS